MRVLLAEEMGMCFGVRDALKVLDDIETPDAVTIHGQLVHNEVVLRQLGARGFLMAAETDRERLPESETVLVTAHGISNRERSRLEGAGRKLVDTTCPLVRRVHETAMRLQSEGCHVIVIGRAGHVEVRGIVEDLQRYTVVETPADATAYPSPRLAIVSQTTVAPRTVTAVHAAIVAANPQAEIRFVDTTCQPTRNRQRAVEKLLPLVQAMVVVGGRNSNNTRELVELCRLRGVKTFQVRDASDLQCEWFRGMDCIGLTAGTSTLDETIRSVREWLYKYKPQTAEQEHSRRWIDHFRSNRERRLAQPWELGAVLSEVEGTVLIHSLQDFQLGESSDGTHGPKMAGRYAQSVDDPGYVEAVRLFFAEEAGHAALLKRYLELAGASVIQRSWTDYFFRRLACLTGLETMITVVLSAELIGKVYDRAIRAGTECQLLRRIFTQFLRDEHMHLRFHTERLRIIRRNRSQLRRCISNTMHRLLFCGTCLAFWQKHGPALRINGYGFRRFWREAWREFGMALRGMKR